MVSSDFLNCDNGARQGENLSPFLFSIFIDDLKEFFDGKTVLRLQIIKNAVVNILLVYSKSVKKINYKTILLC